ncbi:DUF3048 domain-containing protein [Garciella nitratireducens]|uniref:DUF3048 domain-containing protein n=1 Tax=Garciella nitratireducens TaxID=218205 RepID=UPI001BD42ABD|nr:DUF3048 domain-containing protein [Garciella nitratireducens]
MKKYAFFILSVCIGLLFSSCSRSSEQQSSLQQELDSFSHSKSIPVARYDHVPKGISPFTGLSYDGDGRGIIVQIENTAQSRPQSGISKADLIYEMEVESQITRLTAFFLSEYPDKVGPVRSTRKQHIYLWKEWDYPYVFYGGSQPKGQNIYEIIKNLEIQAPKIDGMETQNSFFRSKDRSSPHNAYIDLSNVIKYAYHYQPKQRSIYFDPKSVLKGTEGGKVRFSYNKKNEIFYLYNEKSKEYERFINGEPMIDQENQKQVTTKNIIIQYANHYKVPSTVYTNIDLVGSGKAMYFTEGIMRTGTWKRKDIHSFTLYYDENGKELPLRPGKTFIQIVRPEIAVNVE